MRYWGTRVRTLTMTALVCVGCGVEGAATAAYGEYETAGPAFCEITEPGEPLDSFSLEGRVVVSMLPSGRAPDCQHRLQVEAELCTGCAPTSCELCLRDESAAGWSVRAGYADDEGLDSCHFVGDRGGPSLDLYVYAQDITGTFGPAGDEPVVRLDMQGTVSTGIAGADRPASIHCEIHTMRAP